MAKVKELSLVRIDPYEEWKRNIFVEFGFIKSVALEVVDEDISEEDYLKSLDPCNWKEQDHYAVLGLRNTRFFATEDDLRRCYRKQVLKHHPDKRGAQVDIENDYFACITKAYEILGDPTKRRSYDSVDPHFDDSIASISCNSKSNFYEVFGPIFLRNARWSTTQPVPSLGDDNSSREEVEHFYNFWYSFDSWREFSYLDEEDKERGQDRGERRWIEKQNKIVRQKRKKEEMTRIRQLTDNAYNCDPRVLRFKEEEKQRKAQQKLAKEEARKAKLKEEEENRRKQEEEERRLKEEEEERAKALKEQSKKEKEAMKKIKRKERKLLEQLLEKFAYFASNESEKIKNMEDFDKICHFYSFDDLITFKNSINNFSSISQKKELFFSEVERINNKINKEKEENTLTRMKNSNTDESIATNGSSKWSHDDTQLLIKAVNLFPAGTQNRWDVIGAFLSQHSSSGIPRKAKEVLSKAKSLQKLDPCLKEEANRKAATNFLGNAKLTSTESVPSERYETPAELQGLNPEPWSNEEQKLLEQALKSFPSSTVDRWDKIAECIPSRSKKDCMKRYKELAELVRAKKAAQDAVNKGKTKI